MAHPPNRMNAIQLVQGQTKTVALRVKTGEGRPVPLQDVTLYMSVRKVAGSSVLISKVSGNGIHVTDSAKGEAVITLNTTDTSQLETGTYRYDIWIEFPAAEDIPMARYPIVQYAELNVGDAVTSFE